MSEPSEAAFIPVEELEVTEKAVLPADRPLGHFESGESVVVFAPVTNAQRNLKCGEVERISDDGLRVTVKFDVPPIACVRFESFRERGVYSAGLRQPILMKAAEYEQLRGDEERIREWAASGYVDTERRRGELERALLRVGVFEKSLLPTGVDQEVRTGRSSKRRSQARRIRTDSGPS